MSKYHDEEKIWRYKPISRIFAYVELFHDLRQIELHQNAITSQGDQKSLERLLDTGVAVPRMPAEFEDLQE